MRKKDGIRKFVTDVIAFWRAHGRHALPWRVTQDPYAILVSEIMLQQTQVDRVVPYFTEWMQRFPTPQTLAEAPLSEVLRTWSGLGYNRRAKMLHLCAKAIEEHHGGAVPDDLGALRALPGIGVYTAGAVCAFAFDRPGVFVETNIRTVILHHFFNGADKIDDGSIAAVLEECLPHVSSARVWYSALMDYGAYLKKMHPNPSRRSKHHAPQSRFEGSLRQARGAVMRASLMGPVRIPRLHEESGISAALLTQALRDLKREGMIVGTTRSR